MDYYRKSLVSMLSFVLFAAALCVFAAVSREWGWYSGALPPYSIVQQNAIYEATLALDGIEMKCQFPTDSFYGASLQERAVWEIKTAAEEDGISLPPGFEQSVKAVFVANRYPYGAGRKDSDDRRELYPYG